MTLRRARLCIPAVILLGAALLSLPGTSAAAERAAGPGDTAEARARLLPPGVKDTRLAVRQMRGSSSGQRTRRSPRPACRPWATRSSGSPSTTRTGLLYVKLVHAPRHRGTTARCGSRATPTTRPPATDFPAGDCRNGVRTSITDDQVNYLIDQFDNNIYPKESDIFSVPPALDGVGRAAGASILDAAGRLLPGRRRRHRRAGRQRPRRQLLRHEQPEHVLLHRGVLLVAVQRPTSNRNVMTIDAWDWLHRTGANPPHEPTADPCTSAPARPFLYEGVFAHEYQHLLESYEDPGETIWVNEGIVRLGACRTSATWIARSRSRTSASTATRSASSAGSGW